MQEAKGFKDDIGKDKYKNKLRKQERKTAKEKRADKLNSLLSNPKSWRFLENAELRQEYYGTSKMNAENVVEEVCYGTSSSIDDAITQALDYKVATKISPYLEDAGKEIEEQVFWCQMYGNK